MPRTYQSDTKPRLNEEEERNMPHSGIRSSALGTTTATATVVAATVMKDLGIDQSRTVTLMLTDLIIYSDNNGALVQVLSGSDIIWQTYTGSSTGVFADLDTWLVADKGKDLSVAITGATAKCSVAWTGRAIIGHNA